MQKSKTIKGILILLAVMMLFTSCGKKTKDPASGSLEDIASDAIPHFALVLPQDIVLKNTITQTKMNEYTNSLEEQLKGEGFNISIDIVPNSENFQEKYKEYVKTKLEEVKNVVFFDSYFSKDEIVNLKNNGLIMEVTDIYKESAPVYYADTYNKDVRKHYYRDSLSKLFMDEQNRIYGIPTGDFQYLDYSVLLIRKEIAKRYGKDIDTIDDYEELLKWVEVNDKQFKPGLFPINISNAIPGSLPVFSLWANINGYSDVTGQMGMIGSSVDYYYKNNDVENIIKVNRLDIIEAVQLPDFKRYMLKLSQWQKSGLVDFWMAEDISKVKTDDYATIVTNISNYMRSDSIFDKQALINASEYDMYIFNKEGMKKSTCKAVQPYLKVLYVSANSKNPDEMLRFIEWLYSEQENYDLFIYGKEGKGYVIDGGREVFGEKQFEYFIKFEFEGKRDFHPNNWDKMLELISTVPERGAISLNDYVKGNTDIGIGKLNEIYNKNIYISSTEDRIAYGLKTIDFFKEIFTQNESNLDKVIDDYIRDISNMPIVQKTKDGYSKYIEALFELLKNSGE